MSSSLSEIVRSSETDEQEIDGLEHINEHVDDRRGKHRERLGRFLGDAFRRDLTEDQDDDRHGYGRGRGAGAAAEHLDEQDRGDGRGRDVDDVVAYEYGGDQLVVVSGKAVGELRAPVAAFRKVLDADAVQRGERRLRRGKIRRQDDHNDDGDD